MAPTLKEGKVQNLWIKQNLKEKTKERKEGTVSKNDSAVWVREGIEMVEGWVGVKGDCKCRTLTQEDERIYDMILVTHCHHPYLFFPQFFCFFFFLYLYEKLEFIFLENNYIF